MRPGGSARATYRTSSAVEPEVDVQPPLVGEAEEQVLAVGLGGGQRTAGEEGGTVGEPALRAGHVHRGAAEAREVLASVAVDGMTSGTGTR